MWYFLSIFVVVLHCGVFGMKVLPREYQVLGLVFILCYVSWWAFCYLKRPKLSQDFVSTINMLFAIVSAFVMFANVDKGTGDIWFMISWMMGFIIALMIYPEKFVYVYAQKYSPFIEHQRKHRQW